MHLISCLKSSRNAAECKKLQNLSEKQKHGIKPCVLKSLKSWQLWPESRGGCLAGSAHTMLLLSPATKRLPPLVSASLLFSLRPDPMECLQMVKQEEMGRKGREGRPRHRARGSPSSAEGWPKSCSRQRGRDSCCGGGRLRRERNSLETALFYTLISHRSCPWHLFVGGRSQSLRGPGRNLC